MVILLWLTGAFASGYFSIHNVFAVEGSGMNFSGAIAVISFLACLWQIVRSMRLRK